MQVPPQISFHGIDRSSYNEDFIRGRIKRLEHIHDSIISCRVVVERPHQNKQTGNPYRCRVELSLPRKRELVASKEENKVRHVELRTVIGRTFDAMEKQLRAAISTHERRTGVVASGSMEQMIGVVEQLYPEKGYGHIRTADGREFHMAEEAIVPAGLDGLYVGAPVSFSAEIGDTGLQARTVQLYIDTDENIGLSLPDDWEVSYQDQEELPR
jgi:cold shock CspA family protein